METLSSFPFGLTINFSLQSLIKMAYKLEVRKGIYNLVGQMPKRDTVAIYRNQYTHH